MDVKSYDLSIENRDQTDDKGEPELVASCLFIYLFIYLFKFCIPLSDLIKLKMTCLQS